MGCDYYIEIFLDVLLKDGTKQTKSVETQKCYRHMTDSDSDVELSLEEEMKIEENKNPPKILYKDGMWVKAGYSDKFGMYFSKEELPQIQEIMKKISTCKR
jgi:hypothetical protein